MFGKRKRETVVVAADSQRSGEHKVTQGELSCNDPYEAFRRHFETAFTPLPEIRSPVQGDEASLNAESESDESEVSEWSGFSEVNKDIPPVLVVEHATTGSSQDVNAIDHHFQKAFMSSKPPKQPKSTASNPKAEATEEDGMEKLNIKHDLDLQRLLKESHLLEQSKALSGTGRQRQRAVDMRLQDLGARTSLFSQEKMPLSHRRGMTEKAAQKEVNRRQNAKENGIILERAVKKPFDRSKRTRGVDVPAVGRFQSGTLRLSRKDVSDIQGSRLTAKRKKGR